MASFAAEFAAALLATSSAKRRWVVVFSPTGCEAMLRVLGRLDEWTGRVRRREREGGDDTESESNGKGEGESRRAVFVACIGPTTRDYLEREFGFRVDVCAETPSPEGVGEGIRRFMVDRGEMDA